MAKNVLEMFRLDGKRALVTGGSKGLGKVIATALAEAARPEVVIPAAARIQNVRKGNGAGVWNAQLFRPVAISRGRAVGLVAGVPAESRLVYRCRIESVGVG